ncbi:MAG: extracellular solute-binding protein [Actinomycetota bacterium]
MKRGLLVTLSVVTATTMVLAGCSKDKKAATPAAKTTSSAAVSAAPSAAPASSSSATAGAASTPASTVAATTAPGGDGKPIKIAFQQFGEGRIMDDFLKTVTDKYQADNPGSKVELNAIQASENDYYTKLALLVKSDKTTPDIIHEDTFLINSDISAGYLKPLDDYLAAWDQWPQYVDNAKAAGRGLDGKVYGVPDGTDTRGLWYNKEVLAKAGIAVPWAPKTWDDVLAAARAVKAKVPGVTPINVYASKAAGEATSMQGFEMLMYGTGASLYDAESKKWIVGSKQFKDSLGFMKTVFSEKLGPNPQQALDAQLGNIVHDDLLPSGKLAIALDGSWLPGGWGPKGGKPWPEWADKLGVTAMPTQTGQAPGSVSLSGGWTWAISAKSAHPDEAFKVIQALQNAENATKYTNDAAQISVRKDVAGDQAYKDWTGKMGALSEVVAVTQYRPAYSEYPRISNEIQVAAEAVATGQSPEKAAAAYDAAVKRIVGEDKTITK